MNRVRTYFGGGLAALGLVPVVFVIFAVAGAGSGVVPLQPREPEPRQAGSSPFPLNPEINWVWFYGILLVTTVVSLLILAVLTWRRPRFGADYHAPLEDARHEKEFQQVLHLLSLDSDPGRAIRLIFETAETKIEHLPRRVAPETPFEWTARVKTDQPHLGDPLDQLSKSYAQARFAPDVTSTHERDIALQALRELKHLSDNIVIPVSPVPVLPWA